jgi:hypothetical protein
MTPFDLWKQPKPVSLWKQRRLTTLLGITLVTTAVLAGWLILRK